MNLHPLPLIFELNSLSPLVLFVHVIRILMIIIIIV